MLVNELIGLAVVVTAIVPEVIVSLTVLLHLVVFCVQEIILALGVLIISFDITVYNSIVNICVVKSGSWYPSSIKPEPFCAFGPASLVNSIASV